MNPFRRKLSFYLNILLQVIPVAVSSFPLLAIEVPQSPEIMGSWASAGFGSRVDIQPCESGRSPVELCGTITWLWQALDDDGAPRTDGNNADRSARNRPLIGTQILSGFYQHNDGTWRGGKVYNPDDGRFYSGTIQLAGAGRLKLKGCALKVFCQTQVWRRTSDVCRVVQPLARVMDSAISSE